MKEFDYELDYKNIDFKDERNRKLYRIGRGEQGVLLVRPYTNDICNYWRFKTPDEAVKSSNKILAYLLDLVKPISRNLRHISIPMKSFSSR